jgi:hypothetical protein
MKGTVLFESKSLKIPLNRSRLAAAGSLAKNANSLSKLSYLHKTDFDPWDKSCLRRYFSISQEFRLKTEGFPKEGQVLRLVFSHLCPF